MPLLALQEKSYNTAAGSHQQQQRQMQEQVQDGVHAVPPMPLEEAAQDLERYSGNALSR